jgi:hypothetical protein
VNIQNLYISPDFKPFQEDRPKYVIEVQEMDLAALKRKAKKVNDKAGKKIWNLAEINKIEEEDFKEMEKQAKDRHQAGISQSTPVNKKITLYQFWGDIIPKEGSDIKENKLIVLANKKHIIRDQDNPFDHGLPPYIWSYPLIYPHRGISGISLVEPTAKLQYIYNNILNMFVDNLNFTVNKMFEFNANVLTNPENVLSVYPGKTIPVTSSTEPALREIKTTGTFKEAINGLEVVGREIDEGTMVTEFLTGMPSKKTKTLGEVELKTAESKGMFDTIAKDLERNSIRPLLEMSYNLCVQFGGMPGIEGKYIFKVGGLSLLLMQKDQIDKITQVLLMAEKMPDLKQITDIDDLWKKLLGIYNLSDAYRPVEKQKIAPEIAQEARTRAVQDAKDAVANLGPEGASQLLERKAG